MKLRYVSDDQAGIARLTRHGAFAYRRSSGGLVKDPSTLNRIRHLAIPPAWRDVWICARDDGHIQATGRDARGRKQYRYHTAWRETRDANKFDRLIEFGRKLPGIRRQVAIDLRQPPLSRTAVLATVVRLLEATLIRVGNEEYARTNHSFGLTTLRHRHVSVSRGDIRFHFRGKSGKMHDIALHDPRLATRVRQLQHLPGQELFHYKAEDGSLHVITSEDVNEYLHNIAGNGFSAKDFRTWAGTLAAASLLSHSYGVNGRLTKRQITEMIERVAGQLGNTAAICRKSYIHPMIIENGRQGIVLPLAVVPAPSPTRRGLNASERALLRFLRVPAGRRST